MSKLIANWRNQYRTYLSKHNKTKIFTEYLNSFLLTMVSALLFALTFKMFQSPNVANSLTLISGGTAGLARTVSLAVLMGLRSDSQEIMTITYSISYAIFNLPIIILAFKKIGFRFAIFTTLNIIATSIMTIYVNIPFVDELATQVACVIPMPSNNPTYYLQAGLLARAFLAGVFSGAASALAFSCGASSGGADTLSYYFSMRKSNNVGRYIMIINTFVVILFAVLNTFSQIYGVNPINHGAAIANGFIIIFFVMIFSLVSSIVIDIITRNNKKEQIEIITKNEKLAKLILSSTPHGATIMHCKGAFSGEEYIVIYIIVSTFETMNVVKTARECDPNSFINVTSVKQVYGRFARPKVK